MNTKILMLGAVLLVALISGYAWLNLVRPPETIIPPPEPNIGFSVSAGERENVFTSEQEIEYGLSFYPDLPMGTLKKDGIYYWWFADDLGTGAFHSPRLVGQSLDNMRPDPATAENKAVPALSAGPEGSIDSTYAGIASVYFDNATGKLYAWYHAGDENFPENVIENAKPQQPTDPAGLPMGNPYYGSIAAAVSSDMGRTFQKLGQVVTQKVTKQDIINNPSLYRTDTLNGHVIRDGDYFYMYYTDWDPDAPVTVENAFVDAGLAVARLALSDLDNTPQPWMKYYNGSFSEPGAGGRFTLLTNGMTPFVGYNSYLERWIMFHNHGFDPLSYPYIALRTSSDGLIWSERMEVLIAGENSTMVGSPTIVDDSSDDPRISDNEFWLYYGYSDNLHTDSLKLVRSKIIIVKNNGDNIIEII